MICLNLGVLVEKDPNLIRWCRVQFALLLLIGMCLVLMNNIKSIVIPTEMKLKKCVVYVVCLLRHCAQKWLPYVARFQV